MTTHASTRSAGGGRLDEVPAGVNPERRRPGAVSRLGARRRPRFWLLAGRIEPPRSMSSRSVQCPCRHPGCEVRGHHRIRWLIAGTLVLFAGVAAAAELLVGTMPDGNGTEIGFGLEAEDRQAIVGGRILLGETAYEISRESRLGLIGARRFVSGSDAREPYAEFVVLSSSFSEQTAVGKPWLAARESYGCDQPYNTYLALYRVEGEAAVKALGPIPYPELTEEHSRSQDSRVFCFIARPPG